MEVHIEHICEGDAIEWRGVNCKCRGIVDRIITSPRKLYLVALSSGKHITVGRDSLSKIG